MVVVECQKSGERDRKAIAISLFDGNGRVKSGPEIQTTLNNIPGLVDNPQCILHSDHR